MTLLQYTVPSMKHIRRSLLRGNIITDLFAIIIFQFFFYASLYMMMCFVYLKKNIHYFLKQILCGLPFETGIIGNLFSDQIQCKTKLA